jgi:hypothetical protein
MAPQHDLDVDRTFSTSAAEKGNGEGNACRRGVRTELGPVCV